MSYKGMMDGWHGDENECNGNCTLCSDCEDRYYQSCDNAYESWREEDAA